MNKGFVKVVVAAVVFPVGVIFLFAVVAYIFGALKINQDQQGNRYFVFKLTPGGSNEVKCWIDLPNTNIPRCIND